jgi:Na+-translocating ferredoxin:NAD+ oxidoreductase subunit C
MSLRRLLSRAQTFRHGIHPEEHKDTAGLPIERMPFVEEYVLPLSQHTGAPSRPLVVVGQNVRRGEMIAAADGYISTALHAPVTGTVSAIEPRPHSRGVPSPAIILRIDPFASQRLEVDEDRPTVDTTPAQLIDRVQRAGLVGMGGAAFPSHVKLEVPKGKKARFVILNGCECEPYLTCDHRLMLERADAVIAGLRMLMRQVGAERGYIGVERNKDDAAAALVAAALEGGDIDVVRLEVKYPQGAEKMLIDAILHRELPSGKLPIDLEVVVNNVGTAAALADLAATGKPMVERVVTVAGNAVRRPANLLIPVGTLVQQVLDHCGGLRQETRQVILGGPMMGAAQKRLDIPVLKGISGILAFTDPVAQVAEEPCIRCGRCLEACPVFLNPSRLALLARAENVDALAVHHMMDCMECASCSYVCPSNIPLVHLMRLGKAAVRSQKASP